MRLLFIFALFFTTPLLASESKTMPQVTVYMKPSCPYCVNAKALLDKKEVKYTEIDVGANPDKAMEMIKRADGRRTVPQIFIGDEHIGGFDDMQKLDKEGKLDQKLGL